LALLDHPTTSPYGNPIPGLDKLGAGEPAPPVEPDLVRVDEVARRGGGMVQVRRIAEHVQLDTETLTSLKLVGLVPGGTVEVCAMGERGSGIEVKGAGNATRIQQSVAQRPPGPRAVRAADRAARAFQELHDRPPTGVWSAPGRVNLIGEHTDYNDGFVLPFALPHRTAVAARRRSDGVLAVTTVGDDGRPQHADPLVIADLAPDVVTGWASYPAGVAWVLRDHGYVDGADLVIAGDVPAGAGLSSSAALECGTLLALLGLAGREVGPDHAERAGTGQVGTAGGERLRGRAQRRAGPDRVAVLPGRPGVVPGRALR